MTLDFPGDSCKLGSLGEVTLASGIPCQAEAGLWSTVGKRAIKLLGKWRKLGIRRGIARAGTKAYAKGVTKFFLKGYWFFQDVRFFDGIGLSELYELYPSLI